MIAEAATVPLPLPLPLPASVGPYQVRGLMGEGGTGRVYYALHGASGAAVAVKVPKGAATYEREAFRREIAALTRLSRLGHPGIVQLIESGADGGVPWYAMQFVAGSHLETFRERLWRSVSGISTTKGGAFEETLRLSTDAAGLGPEASGAHSLGTSSMDAFDPTRHELPTAAGGRLRDVMEIGLALARALDAVHAQGVVHGDVTPRNVILHDSDDAPVLVDFGTAFLAHVEGAARELPHTASQMVTRAYSAPERARYEPLDARADIYALGCILYELLTNCRPTAASDGSDTRPSWIPASERVSGVPAQLDELLLGMLASEPSERVGHAGEVASVLSNLLGHSAVILNDPLLTRARPLYRARLAGREDVLQQLSDQLRAAVQGAGGMVVVRGESGIGKTRLLNEVARWASASGMRVLTCHFGESNRFGSEAQLGERTLAGFAGLFEAIADLCVSAPQRALEPGLRDALVVLQPYSAGALESLGLPAPPDGETTRGFLFHQLWRALEFCLQSQPMALLFDDLQWADELTLAAIEYCLPKLSRQPLLFVCSCRSHQSSPTLDKLTKAARATVTLDRLDQGTIHALAQDMLGARVVPTGLGEFLFETSEGNPFLAAEYLRAALAADGLRLRSSGTWAFDARALQGAPRSLLQLFESRLAGVSALAREALKLAAVLGRDFDVELLAALPGAEQFSKAEALEELVSCQLLDWVSPGRYRFAHDSVRELQERALAPEQRRALHRTAALELTQHGTGNSEQLGAHWALAGEPATALPYLESAARDARAGHAPRRAVELYRLALDQCLQLPALGFAIPRLREALGDALLVQAQHVDARAAYDQCLDLLPGEEVIARARVLRKKGASFSTAHDYRTAEQCQEQARSALGDPAQLTSEGVHEYIEIQLGCLERLYFARNVGDVTERLVTELTPLILQHGTPSQRCLFGIGSACERLARHRYELDERTEELMRIAVPDDSAAVPLHMQANAWFALGFVLVPGSAEQRREGLTHLERAAFDARHVGDSVMLARALTYQALAMLRLGDVAGTARAAGILLDLAETIELPPYIAAALSYQGWAAWRGEQAAKAWGLLRRALAIWAEHPHSFPFQWSALLPLIGLSISRKEPDQLSPWLKQLLHPTQQRLPAELEQAIEQTLRCVEAGVGVESAGADLIACARSVHYC